MKLLSVGLKGDSEVIKERLQQDCNEFAQEGLLITVDERNCGKYTFLGCNLTEGELSYQNYEKLKDVLRKQAAKLLADFIILREEQSFIKKTIEHKYNFFNENDKKIVFNHAVDLLNSHNLNGDFDFNTRRDSVFARLQEYLNNQYEVVVDGFITFRLKDYCQRLKQVIDRAVDEYMLDIEYQEFIRLLKYFVSEQEIRTELLHVVVGDKGNFHIIDKEGNSINGSYLENFIIECDDGINYDDMLISALIAIAPRSIMLHNPWHMDVREVVKILRGVFDPKQVGFCYGCELCLDKC